MKNLNISEFNSQSIMSLVSETFVNLETYFRIINDGECLAPEEFYETKDFLFGESSNLIPHFFIENIEDLDLVKKKKIDNIIFSFDFLTAHLFLKKLKSSSEKNSGVKNSILNYKKILDLYNPNVKLRLNISDVCLYYEMKSEIELNLDKKFVLPYVVSQNMDRGLLKERLPNLKDDNSNLLYIGSEVLYANKMGFLSAFVEKPFGVDINNLSSHLGGITLNLNGLGEDAKSYFLINDRKQYLTCVKKLILNGFLPPKNEYYGNLENSVLDSIRFEHMKLRMNMRAHNS